MKRSIFSFPDAINCKPDSDFTLIPNNLLRDPEISAKAKTIQSLLLSNKKGWKSTVNSLSQFMIEGRDAILKALHELEEKGYLLRLTIRKKTPNKIAGKVWIYTDSPFHFNGEEFLLYRRLLRKKGYIIVLDSNSRKLLHIKKEKLSPENQVVDESHENKGKHKKKLQPENQVPASLYNKKTNKKTKKEKIKEKFKNHFPEEWYKNPEFKNLMVDFILHRKQKKSPITPIAAKRLANKLTKFPIEVAIEGIEKTLENGYTGIFPEEKKEKPKSTNSIGKRNESNHKYREPDTVI